MTLQQSQADDITMSGGGRYSLATIGAKDVIDGAAPLVLRAVDHAAIGARFRLCDMGCADGGTSLAMIGSVVDRLRERQRDLPIEVVYADQPRNDFNALVSIVGGLTDFDSYSIRADNVFPTFSATSFYRRIHPPATLDLGFSATAMHWLSAKPCDISNHVHAVGAKGAELEAFRRQGRQDWATILACRAAELKPGARLVLINFCRDEAGRYLGNTGGINMFDTLNDIWRQFLDDGTISGTEYTAMTLPQYYNDVAEFRAPLEDPASEAHRAGLRLEHIETRVVRCPFAADFERHGDARKFAREYIPTIRSWNESIFYAGLSAARPASERQAIIERYYGVYESMVAAAPSGHAMDYVHAYMVIRKDV